MEFSNNLGEFINECLNYKYSAEALEIEKSLMECQYAKHYIEALQFASNNISNYNDNFFSESMRELILEDASSDKMTSTKAVIVQNEQNTGDKILQTIFNFFGKIWRFFKRIAGNVFIKNDYLKTIMLVNNTTLDPNDQRRIAVAYKQATANWKFGLEADPNAKSDVNLRLDKSLTTVRNNVDENDRNDEIERANNELAIYNYAMNNMKILFSNKLIIKFNDEYKSAILPMSIEDISTVIAKFEEGITKNKDITPMIADIYKKYDKKFGGNPSITLDLSSQSLDELGTNIESLISKMQELKKNNVNFFKQTKKNAIATYSNQLIESAGGLLNTIQQIVQTRKAMVLVLKDIVSKYGIFNSKKTSE